MPSNPTSRPKRRRGPKKQDKGGRPTLLTPETHKRLVDFIRAGNFPETAAAAVGVSRPAIRSWMREGADLLRLEAENQLPKPTPKQRRLMRFMSEIDVSMAEAEARDVMLVGKHANDDWRAAAWRLRYRNRERWGDMPRPRSDSDEGNADPLDPGPSEIAIVYDGPPPPPVKA